MSGPAGAAIGDQRRWNQILSAVLAIGFLFHVIPRPRAWTLLHLHKEDGLIFLTDFLERGWGSVFEIYSGYTHLLPRILTAVGLSLLPLEWFAVWVGVSVALVKVMIAYLAHGVYRHWVGQGGAALVAASTVLFMPIGQQEVLGNYTNLRWFMVLALVLASLARFSGPWVNSALIGVSLVAVFTEPLTVVALPVLLYSAVTARGWQRAPSVVGAVAVVANLTLVLRPGDRGDVLGVTYFLLNPSETVRQVAIRGVSTLR